MDNSNLILLAVLAVDTIVLVIELIFQLNHPVRYLQISL